MQDRCEEEYMNTGEENTGKPENQKHNKHSPTKKGTEITETPSKSPTQNRKSLRASDG